MTIKNHIPMYSDLGNLPLVLDWRLNTSPRKGDQTHAGLGGNIYVFPVCVFSFFVGP